MSKPLLFNHHKKSKTNNTQAKTFIYKPPPPKLKTFIQSLKKSHKHPKTFYLFIYLFIYKQQTYNAKSKTCLPWIHFEKVEN
jgi:hypothetical protein